MNWFVMSADVGRAGTMHGMPLRAKINFALPFSNKILNMFLVCNCIVSNLAAFNFSCSVYCFQTMLLLIPVSVEYHWILQNFLLGVYIFSRFAYSLLSMVSLLKSKLLLVPENGLLRQGLTLLSLSTQQECIDVHQFHILRLTLIPFPFI